MTRSFEDARRILRLAGRKLHGLSVLCLRYYITLPFIARPAIAFACCVNVAWMLDDCARASCTHALTSHWCFCCMIAWPNELTCCAYATASAVGSCMFLCVVNSVFSCASYVVIPALCLSPLWYHSVRFVYVSVRAVYLGTMCACSISFRVLLFLCAVCGLFRVSLCSVHSCMYTACILCVHYVRSVCLPCGVHSNYVRPMYPRVLFTSAQCVHALSLLVRCYSCVLCVAYSRMFLCLVHSCVYPVLHPVSFLHVSCLILRALCICEFCVLLYDVCVVHFCVLCLVHSRVLLCSAFSVFWFPCSMYVCMWWLTRERFTGYMPPYARTGSSCHFFSSIFLFGQSDFWSNFQVSKTIFDSPEIIFLELLLLFWGSCYFLELLLGSSIWWRELGETPSDWFCRTDWLHDRILYMSRRNDEGCSLLEINLLFSLLT